MKGIWHQILKVDLSTQTAVKEAIPEDVYRRFNMGIGLGTYLLYQETPQGADPLGPDNPCIICPGLLVETGAPTGSKTVMTFKSPLTGTFGRSVAGAALGCALRKSGYDALVISGQSKDWVTLKIEDDAVEFLEAEDLRDLDTIATQDRLQETFGPEFRTCAIGSAGEHCSLIAGVDFEKRQAGRAGGGAVFGSKKLKAVMIKGTRQIEVHDPDQFKASIKKWTKILKDHPATQDDVNYGSGEMWEWINKERGTCPARNFQWGYFQSVYDRLQEGERSHLDPYYYVPKYQGKRVSCPRCTKPCGRILSVKDGKYAGASVDGFEYELLMALGSVIENDDIEATIRLNEICDREGFDGISAGVTLAWAMEAYEKGFLDKEKLEGLDLSFGNADAAIEVLQKMARREGYIGNLLADGTKKAAEQLGQGSDQFAIQTKGLEFPAYDVRGIKGAALAFAVSPRGACHLSSAVYNWELAGKYWKFEDLDRLSSVWKGFQVKTAEDLATIYDVFGICKFSRHMFHLEGFAEFHNALTGLEMSHGDMLLLGERIYNLQKMFNFREGLDRRHDSLPYRMTHESIPKGVSAGATVTEEELQHMLDDYYQARGWSRNSQPTAAKMAALDLLDVVDEAMTAKA